MAVFNDSDQMLNLLKEVWTHVIKDTEVGPKLAEYEVNYKFVISEPKGMLFVDSETVVTGKKADKDAVITMTLSGDTVHKFWLKKLNLPVALATRKIKSKGPLPKVMKMLPFLKAVHDAYPDYCSEHGISVNV